MGIATFCESMVQNPKGSCRLGLFGGTFNPIHLGHTQVANDVLQLYRLTEICFMPSALPPHKNQGNLATAEDRYEMARLALEGQPAFRVSDVEIQRNGLSYTIDTLRDLTARHAGSVELFFILGLDAFMEIHGWKSFRQLFDLAAFVVMARPQSQRSASSWRAMVTEYAQKWISPDYGVSSQGEALIHSEKKPIHMASVTQVAISSSRIRELIRLGQPIEDWVAPAVAAYIEEKGLYR